MDISDHTSPVFIIVQLVGLFLLIQAIYNSQRRWLSLGFAILGFVIMVAIVLAVAFILPEHALPGSTGWTIDTLTSGMGWVQFLPMIMGAYVPPRRKPVP